jgi:hypothetical protein
VTITSRHEQQDRLLSAVFGAENEESFWLAAIQTTDNTLYLYKKIKILTMAERSRSRSPDRGAPPADNQDQQYPADANPPQNGGTSQAPAPADGNAEEVKLYVGNLDYGALRRISYRENSLEAFCSYRTKYDPIIF